MILSNEDQARAFCAGLADSAAMARLERLAAMVVEENRRQNLMSKPSEGLASPSATGARASSVGDNPRAGNIVLDMSAWAVLE